MLLYKKLKNSTISSALQLGPGGENAPLHPFGKDTVFTHINLGNAKFTINS